MSLGSFDEYVSKSTCGLGKNSRCLEGKYQYIDPRYTIESAYLNRNAKAPIASSSASSSRLRLLLRFPDVSSPTSSLLTVPPSHSIILRTKVSISRPVRERRHIGNLRRAKDQCWSSNTSNSRTRVLASQGRSREEREERVVVMVSGYEISQGNQEMRRTRIPINAASRSFRRLPMTFARSASVISRSGRAKGSKTVPPAPLMRTVPSRWRSRM